MSITTPRWQPQECAHTLLHFEQYVFLFLVTCEGCGTSIRFETEDYAWFSAVQDRLDDAIEAQAKEATTT